MQVYIKNYSNKDGVPKAWAHYRLAQIHTYQKNKPEALKQINLAISLQPKIKFFKDVKEKILNM